MTKIWRAALAVLGLAIAAPALAEPSSSGTGFFVNADGWAVTNAHVLEGCTRAEVPNVGEATNWIVDRTNDLAAVKVVGASAVGHLALRRAIPRLGEEIAAFGFPLRSILSDSIKVTTGNINSLVGIDNDTRYLQISTPLQPGNSGGPVVDRTGAVVGVATAVLGTTFAASTGILPQNVNFAVRSNVLEMFLQGNGIAYETSPDTLPDLPIADLADATVPSVVQILCYGPANQQALTVAKSAPPTPSNIPATYGRQFQTINNFDVIGFDYRTLPSVSQAQCQAACEADNACHATTYNKKERYCFLKNDAAIVVANSDALAYVSSDLTDKVIVSTFRVSSGKDIAGGDYKRIRNSSFLGCYVQCETDPQCRAFAFVRQYADCWMKDRVGRVSTKPGVDLGVK